MNDINKWFADKGDQTLRLNYPLNENSIVFDLGGFHGQWTDSIWEMYKCKIFTFEPIADLARGIKSKYVDNEKVNIYEFGLSNESKQLKINWSNDGSSFNTQMIRPIDCEVKSINEFIEQNKIEEIDLMKINIEGDEFPVLNSLIESGNVLKIKNIQVQFHSFIPNAVEMRKEIQNKLAKTHKQTYNYEFVWENWERL
jgi:FkbM family methyltransferase